MSGPTRRAALHALWVLPLAVGTRAFGAAPPASAGSFRGDGAAAFAELERERDGRLGVCVLDTGSGARIAHRGDERFAMCSTFKLPLAALVFARADRGHDRLDRALPVPKDGLVHHSPVTSTRAGGTMTLAELAHAAQTTSDNTAANLLLGAVGGPAAFTAFARSLGDDVTRLDRPEPEMNQVGPGDERDTTTPVAMAGLLARIVVGDALRPESRATLVGWMRETQTGLSRLRAGLPTAWDPGDKTGTGPDGPTNDVAVAWPAGRAPLVVTAYHHHPGRPLEEQQAVLAEVGRLVASLV